MKMNYAKLFIGGDLSGIQKFLYNISSKKAAISLKGRSFYLQQYMENACKRLYTFLKEAGSSSVETIYSSGGKFYMLADNSPKAIEAVERFSKNIKKEIWEEHLGQLAINISYCSFSENPDGSVNTGGREKQEPGCLWDIVNKGFAKQKRQKFKDILKDNYEAFFCPIAVGGKPKICAVTGIESNDCVSFSLNDEDDEPSFILPSVRQQIQLGEGLREKQHFKTFEEYADNTYLGILRMDVDGLGQRFIKGFNSIKEYQVFSSRLVNFFGKNIEQMQKDARFHDDVNIIYSGGDDLFIIGRWDKVIDFAEKIQMEVKKHFFEEGLTISGGMTIVSPKFPIAKAAEMAGEAEDAAKSFRKGEKNAFHFLGKTISWNDEFDYVKKNKNVFIDLIERFKMSKAILHKIMLYASLAELNKTMLRQGLSGNFSYIWHMSYYLTRMAEREKKNPPVQEFCISLRDHEVTKNNGRNLELLSLSARWAELLLRNND